MARRAVKVEEAVSEYEGMDIAELNEKILELQEIRDRKIGEARRDFKERVLAEAAQLEYEIADLLPKKRAEKGGVERKSAAVKYRGPQGQEWSGRGRSPSWVSEIEKAGKSRDDFKVSD